MKLDIDQERLANELDALGAISQEAPPVVTRVVFTEADLRGREFVKSLAAKLASSFARMPSGTPLRAGWAQTECLRPWAQARTSTLFPMRAALMEQSGCSEAWKRFAH